MRQANGVAVVAAYADIDALRAQLAEREAELNEWNRRAVYAESDTKALRAQLQAASADSAPGTAMRRFTMFRHGDLSATHNIDQANRGDDPQFEGVVFSDGTTAIRWLTPLRSTAVWADFATMEGVHGHPEERYQSELVWHDAALPGGTDG